MEDKRAQYSEDDIISLEFDEGDAVECGIMGVFELNEKQYIALEPFDESNDVYLYLYIPTDDDFELIDIPEDEFDAVAAEFDRLMDEPV